MQALLGLGLGLGVGVGVGVGVGRRCAIMSTVMPPYISPTSPLHLPYISREITRTVMPPCAIILSMAACTGDIGEI